LIILIILSEKYKLWRDLLLLLVLFCFTLEKNINWNTDSAHIELAGYNPKDSPRRHIYNCWLKDNIIYIICNYFNGVSPYQILYAPVIR
jgi:hypothetical protein